MPDTITMTPGQLGARLRADANGAPKAVLNAMFSAAQRGKAFIVDKTPVDRGILRNAWKVIKLSSQMEVQLVNDQPYAGVIERGSRPFKISPEGIEALTGWVKRKLMREGYNNTKFGRDTRKMHWKDARKEQLAHRKAGAGYKKRVLWELDDQAKSIAWAIAKSWEKLGRKGTRFVYMHLPQLAELMDAEVKRYLSDFFNRPFGGK
jgi:predicted metal-dependent phosphotriesterase family hydrolase